ncbi:hypothetical protein LZ016_03935 [Sphingomonas sp. SM33]|uniref:DUF2723 domain-containing protein n=1 Tax=Sphingomonas telluris TaxID=2907998 RepID=A0ABS9VJU4_9SPHN|nr:hypothetical protein [Sphingomonas telluris]MCH8615255.1 hypothetical protein [Sphingomonas telluris]
MGHPAGSGDGTRSWRGEGAIFAATLLFMLWPLLLNGAPFYSEDSPSYLRGGAFGFSTGFLILGHWWQALLGSASAVSAAPDPHAVVSTAVAEAGGTRSVIYSVTTYLLRAPGMTLVALAVAQAAAVTAMIGCFRRLIAPGLSVSVAVMAGAAIAFLTSAGWYAAYAVPDIFAGVAICGALALTVFFDRLSKLARALLVLLTAFSITVHGSHLPLTFAVLVAGVTANLWLRRKTSVPLFAWAAGPLVLAVLALLATSYVAFGELSLAPKRYPIQLARSVADGPGAWYLRDHCATQHYAICELFGRNPPRDVGDFLWAKTGVRYRATPEQMDRIRAEESMIVRAAAMEYPGVQIRRSVTNTFVQLFRFGPQGLIFGRRIVGAEDPTLEQASPDRPALKVAGFFLIYASFLASIVALIAYRRRLTREEVAAICVVAVGLLANAAVCGILSAVTDRYQGRVAWVLPALACAILLRVWNGSRPPVTSA